MTKNYNLYSMGNALLDFEIEATEDFLKEMEVEKGIMTLVDEPRQNLLTSKVNGHIHSRTCGGSAANTTIAFSQLGGSSYYSCKVGDDESGKYYLDALKENGVDCKIEYNKGVSGKCLVFVTPDADRTMNTFLGASATYGTSQLNEEALKSSSNLYVEGYLVTNPDACIAVEDSMKIAFSQNIPISITFSDPFIVGAFKEQFKKWLVKPVDLIFCNEEEAYSFTESGTDISIEEVGQKLLKYSNRFAITRGEKGAYLFDGTSEFNIETTQVKPVDSNGAGDLFAGAFLWGINNELSFEKSGILATRLASLLVTKYGARLEKNEVLKLKKEILK